MTEWVPDEHRWVAVGLLIGWGIDPEDVAIEGIDDTGYYTFDHDERGFKVFLEDGLTAKTRHEWPAGFPLEDFLYHFRKWYSSAIGVSSEGAE